MKKWFVFLLVLIGGGVLSQAIETVFDKVDKRDAGNLFEDAGILAIRYNYAMQQVKSATQVSQISDEVNVQMNYIIVKQNQEIIRLLRKTAGETK